jgi:phosphate transport system substrate-binding protein
LHAQRENRSARWFGSAGARRGRAATLLTAVLLAVTSSCSRESSGDADAAIQITGSDTMVNLTLAWTEQYNKDHPTRIIIKGGGSGVGIANLCSGKVEIATASRAMKPKEIETAIKNTGKTPKEYIVGRDALAIYVNLQNPLETISIGELAEIYGADGTFEHWKDLGVDNAACRDDEIIRVSRQNSSGTYAYFKEAILGKGGEYKEGYTAQSGSSDVVALISNTPCAIGYSGMGYRTDAVKVVKVAKKKGEPGVEPTVISAQDGSYPISRPLYFYTLGEPSGAVEAFINWVKSGEGQKVVEEKGYVPLPNVTASE